MRVHVGPERVEQLYCYGCAYWLTDDDRRDESKDGLENFENEGGSGEEEAG
jgi:hypothetical protein